MKTLLRLLALLFAAFLVGCGGGGDAEPPAEATLPETEAVEAEDAPSMEL